MNTSFHRRITTTAYLPPAAALLAMLMAVGCATPTISTPSPAADADPSRPSPTDHAHLLTGQAFDMADSADKLADWGLWLATQGVKWDDALTVHRVEFANALIESPDDIPVVWAFEVAIPFEPDVALFVFNEHRTVSLGTTGRWMGPAKMLAEGDKMLTIWETAGEGMWSLTFVTVDDRQVVALDCITATDTRTRDRPVIEVVGRELRILGLTGRRPHADLVKFAAEMGMTVTVGP